MALTLIKEDGTARTDANSYATAADGDAYHDGHLYASAWTGATTAKKEAALVMATRLIDSQFQFNGYRTGANQALQWPRERCPDPDACMVTVSVLVPLLGNWVDSDAVPQAVLRATCELARELLIVDRTAAPDGEGIAQFAIAGGMSVTFDKADRRPVVTPLVVSMLAKFGCLAGAGSGAVKLMRS
jgi:hypothetical protein